MYSEQRFFPDTHYRRTLYYQLYFLVYSYWFFASLVSLVVFFLSLSLEWVWAHGAGDGRCFDVYGGFKGDPHRRELGDRAFLNYNVLFLFVNSLVIACKLRSFYLSRLFYYN